ncbi:MAG: hypothetical protein IPM29_07540 [Planctomycetes bacterium]|nr:hypothetical protein [Planctomycetota bacterium]
MAVTPFGSTTLIDVGLTDTPSYLLTLNDFGTVIPLSQDLDGWAYSGSIGSISVSVTQGAVVAGASDGPFVLGRGFFDNVPGWDVIDIYSPCIGAHFIQFITVTVEWTGFKQGPLPPPQVSGSGGAEEPLSSNNGHDMKLDGSSTYVDSRLEATGSNTPPGFNPTLDGEYPARDAGLSTYMEDAPNIVDPTGIVNDIQGANPGVTVTEIKVTMRFTTYVLCGGSITHKIKWTHIETIPAGAVPHYENGSFGGPTPGPGEPPFVAGGMPSIENASDLEPHHELAYMRYMVGLYTGAPNNGASF